MLREMAEQDINSTEHEWNISRVPENEKLLFFCRNI